MDDLQPPQPLAARAENLIILTAAGSSAVDLMQPTIHRLADFYVRAVGDSTLIEPYAREKDYVRVRYVVTEDRSDISISSVLPFTQTIRLSVIAGLEMDPFGVPLNKHWLAGLPSDWPGKPPKQAG
jgi:hypothetical protein